MMKKRYAKRLILCTNTDRVGGVKSLQHFNLDTVVGFATQKSEIKRGINPEIKKISVEEATAKLGISRSTFFRRLRDFK